MPIINTNYGGGNANFEKLLKAKDIINSADGSTDLFPEDFDGIKILGAGAFTNSLPLRRVILPGTVQFAGSTTRKWQYFSNCTRLIFYAGGFPREAVTGCTNLEGIVSPADDSFLGVGQSAVPTAKIKNAAFCSDTIVGLGVPGWFPYLNIYVKDSMLEAYKSATNWSDVRYEGYLHGFSEAPTYDESVTYSCGDVCQYNNKMYMCCHYEAITGVAPSTESVENYIWYYCGEVNS